ncbi:MAG: hypothetical protein ABIO48_16770 [Pedococcus sp.]
MTTNGSITGRVRRLMVESPGSVGGRARARRLELTNSIFPDLQDMTVIDLGGTVDAWATAHVRPRHVTVINIEDPGEAQDWITPVTGDACSAVATLLDAGLDPTCDVVFSNAVLEHVGGHANRVRFAESVNALSSRHWVQTPYRYFPVEPHWLFPGMQFLPVAARTRIAAVWPLAHSKAESLANARHEILWTELIGMTEMRDLFPESRIIRERLAGLTKSLIAVRSD